MLESCPYKNYPVLFVDDEELALLTYQNLFKGEMTIYTALHGEAALETIQAHPEIVVLVTDQRMPRMNGLELLTHVVQKKPDMINILVTAYSDSSLMIDAINKGNLYRYVMKPYNEKILKQEILQGIERYHLIRERDRLYADHIEWLRKAARMQRLTEMGTLTAGMAHNINNSLVAVNTFLKMIPQKRYPQQFPLAASGLEATQQEHDFWSRFYSVALDEVARIQDMVKHILNSVKLPEKEINNFVDLQDTDINTLLSETILLVENEAQKKGIMIKKEYDKTLQKCSADSAKIRQVFMNLLLNAIYATSEGSILAKTMSDGKDHLKIVIEDTGIGIPKENMSKLFSPFFSTKEAHGIGLGLTMSREFIEIHRGSIEVASEVGKGTTITIALPLHPEKNERRNHATDRRRQQGTT